MSKKSNLNTFIKNQRIQLGLAQQDVFQACGMTESEYRDLEDFDDELYMVVQLNTVICICDMLKIQIEELFGFSSNCNLLPQDIVSRKLKEKNLSISELSDFVGIEESYIEAINKNLANISNWVMDPVILMADRLNLNLGSILKSFSVYYGENKQDKR